VHHEVLAQARHGTAVIRQEICHRPKIFQMPAKENLIRQHRNRIRLCVEVDTGLFTRLWQFLDPPGRWGFPFNFSNDGEPLGPTECFMKRGPPPGQPPVGRQLGVTDGPLAGFQLLALMRHDLLQFIHQSKNPYSLDLCLVGNIKAPAVNPPPATIFFVTKLSHNYPPSPLDLQKESVTMRSTVLLPHHPMDWPTLFLLIGFAMASYAVIGNDSLQTLGTFLASNAKRPWWVLWLFAAGVLVVTMMVGWYLNDGDPSYGRLNRFPLPEQDMAWMYMIPPLFLLILTRYGIPVSTTFLILVTFAPSNLESMLMKSLLGYAVAFAAAITVVLFITKKLEKRFLDTANNPIPGYWVPIQWSSTALLWSAWLTQDICNVFIYLPRQLVLWEIVLCLAWISLLMAIIFYIAGGRIQKIVLSKTNTTDIRSATIIDFTYAIILWIFKFQSDMPMSTTWVFLGLLAGREVGFTLNYKMHKMKRTYSYIGRDAVKALIGLGISIALGLGLPALHKQITGEGEPEATLAPAELGETEVIPPDSENTP